MLLVKNNTNFLSLANFAGRVVGFLDILVIRLWSLLLAASLAFDRMRNLKGTQ
jgi:hypothetical protein